MYKILLAYSDTRFFYYTVKKSCADIKNKEKSTIFYDLCFTKLEI